MNFRSRDFLLGHIRHTLAFYDPKVVDPSGGFHHCYMNDGTLFSPGLKTLVASSRFVFNYAKAYRQFGEAAYRKKMIHGLNYLRDAHRNPLTGGYAWKIKDGRVIDATNHCYGLAFVLLAYACALDAGFAPAREWIDETFDVMERHFWSEEYGRYAC